MRGERHSSNAQPSGIIHAIHRYPPGLSPASDARPSCEVRRTPAARGYRWMTVHNTGPTDARFDSAPDLRPRGAVGDDETTRVRTEHRGRHLRRDGPVEHSRERRTLRLAAHEHNHFASSHDPREPQRARALTAFAVDHIVGEDVADGQV